MTGSVRFAVLTLGLSIALRGSRPIPRRRRRRQRYRALVREYQAALQASSRASPGGEGREPGRTASSRKPDPAAFAHRFLDLAKENPGDRASFDALSWVLAHAPHGPEADQAYQLLGASHLAETHLVPILQHLGTSRSPAAEALLRTALEKSPEAEVQAHACYSLALLLGSRGAPSRRREEASRQAAEGQDKPRSEPADDRTPRGDRAALRPLGHGVSQRQVLAQEDVRRPGEARAGEAAGRARAGQGVVRPPAGTTLPEGVGLEVGMIAPEIAGLDTRGQPMRLSAFRGRVVVLDFWGHW